MRARQLKSPSNRNCTSSAGSQLPLASPNAHAAFASRTSFSSTGCVAIGGRAPPSVPRPGKNGVSGVVKRASQSRERVSHRLSWTSGASGREGSSEMLRPSGGEPVIMYKKKAVGPQPDGSPFDPGPPDAQAGTRIATVAQPFDQPVRSIS
eukprot:1226276-Prymnesium_polylepis.1